VSPHDFVESVLVTSGMGGDQLGVRTGGGGHPL